MKPETQADYDKLCRLVDHHNRLYYVEAKTEISDGEFDIMLRRLTAMEQQFPKLRTAASPTMRVGGGLLSGFKSSNHIVPMLSIDNIFSVEDLSKRLDALAYPANPGMALWTVEPKVDGLSLSLFYRDGILQEALTRGDGLSGDDVTANARTIRSIPLRLVSAQDEIHIPKVVHIRGEVFMTFKDFAAVNEQRKKEGKELLANPRNGAAGALKQLDTAECARRRLSFVPYHIAYNDSLEWDNVPQETLTQFLFPNVGFKTLEPVQSFANKDNLIEYISKFEAIRAHLPYPVDGAVIKVSDREARDKFGEGTKFVKWAYAYKYAAEEALTKLNSITIQVGRTGVLTPVAELEPVELSGSVISRASMHNRDRLTKLNVKEGDIVRIRKAGEIIPEIISVETRVPDGKTFVFPLTCPSCSTPVVQAELREEGPGVATLCPNSEGCPAQIAGRLEHWCSKGCMDIQDVGETIIASMVKAGVSEIPDLYKLTCEWMEARLDGFGKRRAVITFNAIQKSKSNGFEMVFAGLGVPRCGSGTARKLARCMENMNDLIQAEGARLDFLGAAKKDAIIRWRDNIDTRLLIRRLSDLGVDMKSRTYDPNAAKGILSGKVFVFTGALETMHRSYAENLVEQNGGRASSSVSKNVLCGSRV